MLVVGVFVVLEVYYAWVNRGLVPYSTQHIGVKLVYFIARNSTYSNNQTSLQYPKGFF